MEQNKNNTEKKFKINILVTGKTGVGKSTLINSIFEKELTKTGLGIPITEFIEEFTDEDKNISLYDTIGTNITNYKDIFRYLENFVKEKNKDPDDPCNHIHAAWLCISEGSSRVEEAEIELEKILSNYLPTIIVLTKSLYDNEFKNEIKNLFPNNTKKVIPVHAKELKLEDGLIVKPKNLKKLIEYTIKVVLNNDDNFNEISIDENDIESSKNSLKNDEDENIYDSANEYVDISKDLINEDTKKINNNNIPESSEEKIQKNYNKCMNILTIYTKIMVPFLVLKKVDLISKVEFNVIESITNIFNIKLEEKTINEIKDYLFKSYDINNSNYEKDYIKENNNEIKENILNQIPGIKLDDDKKNTLKKFYTCIKIYIYILNSLSKELENNEITSEQIKKSIDSINKEKILIYEKTSNKKYKKENIDNKIKYGYNIIDSNAIVKATLIYLKNIDIINKIEKDMKDKIKELFKIKSKVENISNSCRNKKKHFKDMKVILKDISILKLSETEIEKINKFQEDGYKYVDRCAEVSSKNKENNNNFNNVHNFFKNILHN